MFTGLVGLLADTVLLIFSKEELKQVATHIYVCIFSKKEFLIRESQLAWKGSFSKVRKGLKVIFQRQELVRKDQTAANTL